MESMEVIGGFSGKVRKDSRWKLFHHFLSLSCFLGPAVIMLSWFIALRITEWNLKEAQVSHVLAYSKTHYYCLFATLVGSIFILIVILARNIQIQIIFYRESWSNCWTAVNVFATMSAILGAGCLMLLIVFRIQDGSAVHTTFSALASVFILCYQFIHGIVTFRQRINQCTLFLDALYFVVCSVSAAALISYWGLAFLMPFDESAKMNFAENAHWPEWTAVVCMNAYYLMMCVTLRLDASYDEMQLFQKFGICYLCCAGTSNLSQNRPTNTKRMFKSKAASDSYGLYL